jgi:uncharacterized protein (UPF0548 family)
VFRVGAFAVIPSDAQLRELYRQQAKEQPTFGRLGATLRGDDVPAFRRDHYEVRIGAGDEVWRRAVEGLRHWQPQRKAGLRVFPEDVAAEVGTTVLLVIGRAVASIASCRVTQVVDLTDRAGFVYATLPAHPERGEEAFMIERGEDGSVSFAIDALSAPRDPIARVGAPVTRLVQQRVSQRYLRGLAAYATEQP